MEYFSLSKNKNCNCIYLTQRYINTPKSIWGNINCFAFSGNLNNKDIRHISDEHSRDITKDKLKLIIEKFLTALW